MESSQVRVGVLEFRIKLKSQTWVEVLESSTYQFTQTGVDSSRQNDTNEYLRNGDVIYYSIQTDDSR